MPRCLADAFAANPQSVRAEVGSSGLNCAAAESVSNNLVKFSGQGRQRRANTLSGSALLSAEMYLHAPIICGYIVLSALDRSPIPSRAFENNQFRSVAKATPRRLAATGRRFRTAMLVLRRFRCRVPLTTAPCARIGATSTAHRIEGIGRRPERCGYQLSDPQRCRRSSNPAQHPQLFIAAHSVLLVWLPDPTRGRG
jgi:hypothetical protein